MSTHARPDFDPANPDVVSVWDEVSFWSAPVGQLLLDHVPMHARCVLDVGCGAGFPALELAERLGESARVVGVDPWPTALRRAGHKRAHLPVPNADFVRGDGAALPFRGGTFDLVVSNLGVNNFERPAAALAECGRVLATNGTLAIGTNLVGHFREFYAIFDHELERTGDAEARERLRAHVAHRATIDGLETLLAAAGLRVSETHEHPTTWRFRDAAALLSHHLIRWGFLPAWREVAGERADAHLDALARALDQRARDAGELRLSVPFAVVLARHA